MLNKVENNNPQTTTPRFNLNNIPQSAGLSNSINEMFPEQNHEDNAVLKAKQVLGDKYSTEEVKSMLASYEYLVSTWLEEYEKKIFNKKTLKELLRNL